MTIEAHPFALEYPRADQADIDAIEADMRAGGWDPNFPIVLFEGKILDGLTRFGCAERTGRDPTFVDFFGPEERARAFVKRANENRRHLDREWLAARRRERVAEKRQQGQSIRQIAESENVSKTQVEHDLKAVTVQGVDSSPNSGKIKGKDGKVRPAKRTKKKPKARRRCDRCTRIFGPGGGSREGCEQCEDLNDEPEPKKASKGPVGESFDTQFEKLYDSLLLLLDRRAQKMGKDKCFTACLNAAFECRKQYKAWVSA